jgi:hypothetical protein
MGPEMADPFISPLGFTITPALSIVIINTFEIKIVSFSSAEGLSLSHHNHWHDFLSEIRLSLLDGAQT